MMLLVSILCAITIAQQPCPFEIASGTQQQIFAQVQLAKGGDDDAITCVTAILAALTTSCNNGAQPACNQKTAIQTAMTTSSGWSTAQGNLFAGRTGVRTDITPQAADTRLRGVWGSTTDANKRMIIWQQCDKLTITGGTSQTALHSFVLDGVTESQDATSMIHPIWPSEDYVTRSVMANPTAVETAMGATVTQVIYGELPIGGDEIELMVKFVNGAGKLVMQQNVTLADGTPVMPVVTLDYIGDGPTAGCVHSTCPDDWVDTATNWSPACCDIISMSVYNSVSYTDSNMAETCLYLDSTTVDSDGAATMEVTGSGNAPGSSNSTGDWEWNSLSYLLLAIILTLPVGVVLGAFAFGNRGQTKDPELVKMNSVLSMNSHLVEEPGRNSVQMSSV